MNRRQFIKSALSITSIGVVAPKLIFDLGANSRLYATRTIVFPIFYSQTGIFGETQSVIEAVDLIVPVDATVGEVKRLQAAKIEEFSALRRSDFLRAGPPSYLT